MALHSQSLWFSVQKKSLGLSSVQIFFFSISNKLLVTRCRHTKRQGLGWARPQYNRIFGIFPDSNQKQPQTKIFILGGKKKYCALASNHKTPNQRNRFPESRIAYVQQQITTEKIVVHIDVISVSNDVNCLVVLLLLFPMDSNAHSNALSNSMRER